MSCISKLRRAATVAFRDFYNSLVTSLLNSILWNDGAAFRRRHSDLSRNLTATRYDDGRLVVGVNEDCRVKWLYVDFAGPGAASMFIC